MASPEGELTTLLARLAGAGVDFILVEALAAVAQGAPLTTHDVDVVHLRAPRTSIEVEVSGERIQVLGLSMLIELKRGSTHPKDRYTFAILEETLRRVRGS